MSSGILKKKIVGFLRKIRGNAVFKEESVFWLGKVYKVWPGTIRVNVDYDDSWFQFISAGSENIIDIGANIGYSALLSLSKSQKKSLLLIDPNPEALAIAALNLFKNGYSDRAIFKCAFVSDRDGENRKFYTVGVGAAGSMYSDHAKTASFSHSWYYVDTNKLDTIVNQIGFSPDLIKIDVEGAEHEVLKGSEECIKKNNPNIIVEMHSNKDLSMEENASRVIDWCIKNNYSPWYLKEHCKLLSAKSIAHRGKCHLLLIPLQGKYPEGLKSIKQGDKLSQI